MKKSFILPVIIIIGVSILYAQDRSRISTSLILISQGYVINSGLGFTNYTTSTVANIAAINPASMADFTKPSAGVSFLLATQIDSAVTTIGVEHSRVNHLLPQTFGFVLLRGNFRFGLGFNQKYSSSLYFGPFPVTTINDPGGTGETFDMVQDKYIYSGSGLVSYQVPNFISDEHRLSVGLQIDVNFLRDYESISHIRINGEATDQSITWKAGARYSFLDLLQLGLAFEKGANFEGKVEINGGGFLVQDSGFVSQEIEHIFTAKIPNRLLMGLAFKISDKIRLANDFTYTYWEKINSLQRNQLDISGNFYYRASEKLSLSAGFYSTKRDLKNSNGPSDDNALFLSAGILLKLGRAEIETLIADSRLFSSETRKQTLARLGCGFSL